MVIDKEVDVAKALKIGIAGVRGLSSLVGFNAIAGVEVAALCDLNEDILNQ